MPPRLLPPSCRTVFMFCLAACRVMDTAHGRILGNNVALIYDDGLDLVRPSSHIELWMTNVLDDARHMRCPSSISFAMFRMSSKLDAITDIVQHERAGGRMLFDGMVLAVTQCRVADVLEPILMSSTTPRLRLDFIACPSEAAGLEIERLELYRLNASAYYVLASPHEASRDSCGMYAFHKWLEHRICSWSMEATTRRLLLDNEAPFNVTRELQDCSNLDDLQWIRSMRPIRLDVADSARMQQRKGNMLRFASLERPPFVIFERHSDGTIRGFKGYCYEIIHALQKIYNFTYEVDQPKDNTYGTVMPNGSWNGMIRMIKEQVIDIGVGPFSVTYSRSKAVDFTVPFYEEPTGILIPPPAEDNRLLACTKPFRLEVWLSLLLCVTTLPIVLWKDLQLVLKTYQKAASTSNENSKSEEENHFQEKCPSLAKQYFFVLGVLIGQSGQKLPSSGFSPRLLGAFWCLSAVVFASAYVGILVGFLSIPRLSPIISSLEELPGSKLEWGVQRGTALETLFTEATTGVFKTIGEGLLRQPTALVDVNADGIQRVTNGSYAFIKEKSYLEFAVEEDYARSGSCRLSMARQEFFKVNFAFALPTASPLKTLLDKKILQLMETGIGEYWKQIHWPRSNRKCDDVKGSSAPKSLGLTDLQGAFLILAIGSATSSLIFVAEGLVKKRTNEGQETSPLSRCRPHEWMNTLIRNFAGLDKSCDLKYRAQSRMA
ncbi:hypothetical protein OUZ56_008315 [Daphnia magna]|uniref:Uncharacterized protein n=1 Tax=Daphnia magna TaxID=35525 RepID=A0ABR0ACL2_9CRUS|nr:hypothetical protein OUZ56_008315 [Daphnia magna]